MVTKEIAFEISNKNSFTNYSLILTSLYSLYEDVFTGYEKDNRNYDQLSEKILDNNDSIPVLAVYISCFGLCVNNLIDKFSLSDIERQRLKREQDDIAIHRELTRPEIFICIHCLYNYLKHIDKMIRKEIDIKSIIAQYAVLNDNLTNTLLEEYIEHVKNKIETTIKNLSHIILQHHRS